MLKKPNVGSGVPGSTAACCLFVPLFLLINVTLQKAKTRERFCPRRPSGQATSRVGHRCILFSPPVLVFMFTAQGLIQH